MNFLDNNIFSKLKLVFFKSSLLWFLRQNLRAFGSLKILLLT